MRAALMLDRYELEQYPICKLIKDIQEQGVALKVVTRYQFDDHKVFLTDLYGIPHAFSLYHQTFDWDSQMGKSFRKKWNTMQYLDHVYEVTVWESTGTQTVWNGHFLIPYRNIVTATIPKEILHDIEEAMKHYHDNKVRCSDCGVLTAAHDGRHYFAGTYCVQCWEGITGNHAGRGGWKEVEAKETYE